MPFPTVDGITFEEDFHTIAEAVDAVLLNVNPVRRQKVMDALVRIELRLNRVGTQVYDDVQALKQQAAAHGEDIEVGDPSQTPLGLDGAGGVVLQPVPSE